MDWVVGAYPEASAGLPGWPLRLVMDGVVGLFRWVFNMSNVVFDFSWVKFSIMSIYSTLTGIFSIHVPVWNIVWLFLALNSPNYKAPVEVTQELFAHSSLDLIFI
jgi:hypothetical protein